MLGHELQLPVTCNKFQAKVTLNSLTFPWLRCETVILPLSRSCICRLIEFNNALEHNA